MSDKATIVPFRLRPGRRPRPIGALRAEVRRLALETGKSEAEVKEIALRLLQRARRQRGL